MLMMCLMLVAQDESRGQPEQLDTWITKIAQKDTRALEELYESTNASVYAFALSVLKNRQDAEDVLHDCYVTLFCSAGSYRSEGKPMAWILTITRNLCLHKLRERGKTADSPVEDWERCLDVHDPVTPEEKLILRECMLRLSNEERQIVVLHAVNGFKHREIAQLLELPLPTVLSKYRRALQKLRKNL